jgi:hypothetical protein
MYGIKDITLRVTYTNKNDEVIIINKSVPVEREAELYDMLEKLTAK